MEKAAQGRAASVRIGAGSVPVKDRFQQKGRAKRQNSRGVESKKNAASDSALRRVEQKIKGDAAKNQKSELGRFFRRCVGRFTVTIEPFARGLGHPIAQHVTQLGAIRLALLAQFFEPLGVGRQFFHCWDFRVRGICLLRGRGLVASSQRGSQ